MKGRGASPLSVTVGIVDNRTNLVAAFNHVGAVAKVGGGELVVFVGDGGIVDAGTATTDEAAGFAVAGDEA